MKTQKENLIKKKMIDFKNSLYNYFEIKRESDKRLKTAEVKQEENNYQQWLIIEDLVKLLWNKLMIDARSFFEYLRKNKINIFNLWENEKQSFEKEPKYKKIVYSSMHYGLDEYLAYIQKISNVMNNAFCQFCSYYIHKGNLALNNQDYSCNASLKNGKFNQLINDFFKKYDTFEKHNKYLDKIFGLILGNIDGFSFETSILPIVDYFKK